MDAIGSEVGLKMRSAIKAKLMELGCYVDDELPDYVMVMVANKRTRSQMEDDLQLFLATNTEAFVGWLHQVLQKLQEVTINSKILPEKKKSKHTGISGSSKKDSKDKKKDKSRTKEKDKAKLKKAKKEKRKTPEASSTSEAIRPNVPRFSMNPEKESSPSITDVFAGQILRKHGILSNLTLPQVELEESKAIEAEKIKRKLVRNILPIIDPATVTQINEDMAVPSITNIEANKVNSFDIPTISEIIPKEEKKDNKKVAVVESESDDEDYLNIRTEADDLIGGDLEEETPIRPDDTTEIRTPPLRTARKLIEAPVDRPTASVKLTGKDFPQIELNLPKRPLRDRLGVREPVGRRNDATENRFDGKNYKPKSSFGSENIRSRLSLRSEIKNDKHAKDGNSSFKRKLSSRVVPLVVEQPKFKPNPVAVASIVRAPPRPHVQGIFAGPQLLLRAMADAHKSLLNMPPKHEVEHPKKKAFVLPMRRNVNPQKIIIEVPSSKIPGSNDNHDSASDFEIDMESESLDDLEYSQDSSFQTENEYIPVGSKSLKYKDIDYVPTHIENLENEKEIDMVDIAEIPKILNASSDILNKENKKNPQFVVTLDGLDPNVFLEKKLEMISRESDNEDEKTPVDSINENKEDDTIKNDQNIYKTVSHNNFKITFNGNGNRIRIDQKTNKTDADGSHLGNNSEAVKKGGSDNSEYKSSREPAEEKSVNATLPNRKRKASPIIFNITDKKKPNETKKKETNAKSSKYDSIPSLLIDRQRNQVCKFYPECKLGATCEFYHPPVIPSIKTNTMCRAFPLCTFGDKCVYIHPPCKYDISCIRKDCPYSHSSKMKTKSTSIIASHVVPGANYKSVSSSMLPSLCKYHPNCSKVGCGYYHPIPCRFGKKCLNKVECNFFHHNISSLTWKSPHAT